MGLIKPPERLPDYDAELTRLYREGRLYAQAHMIEGLEQAPTALELLFTGRNTGKLIIDVQANGRTL